MRLLASLFLLTISLGVAVLLISDSRTVQGADHGDAPILGTVGRNDAKLTDLFVFRDKNQLVIVLCADPTVPGGVSEYAFQDDVTFVVNIDNTTDVSYSDLVANATYGGTVVHPEDIHPDIKFTITFPAGRPQVTADGLRQNVNAIQVFAGLRDDPFIRRPRIGKNVAAVVLRMPLPFVNKEGSDILVWATSHVPEMGGVQGDLAGRALRSMLLEAMNPMPPNQHMSQLGVVPDVLIYNTRYDAAFPNGRSLTDDVIDLTGVSLPGEDPSPTTNDVPFLKNFPYLAPPQ